MNKIHFIELALILISAFLVISALSHVAGTNIVLAGISYIASDGNIIERYQTFLAGLMALAVGYLTVRELKRQIRFSESLSQQERLVHGGALKNQIMYELRSYFRNLHEAHYGHKDAMRFLLVNNREDAQKRALKAATFAPMQIPPILSDMTLRPYLTEDQNMLVAEIKEWLESFHHSLKSSCPELWIAESFSPGFEWFDDLDERTFFTRSLLNRMIVDLMGFDKEDDILYV